jgi:signal transduction histidine kinase
MIDYKNLNNIMVEKLFENSDKLLFIINKDTKILDYNQSFSEYKNKFEYLNQLITYTQVDFFMKKIKNLNDENRCDRFITNFSFDKNNIEDIPQTFKIIICLNEDDNISVLAEPIPSLSNDDAKMYLSLINDFSTTSRELTKTKSRLKKLNNNLQEEVEEKVKQLREKDIILLKQAKDAALGEMIDSIAHQWKGPLTIIKLIAESIKIDFEILNEINPDDLLSNLTKIESHVDHLVETLDEFRSFFRPNINKEEVNLYKILESVNTLMKDELIKGQITVNIEGDENLQVNIIPNQFKHVLINLISNSRDAFKENNIKKRVINFVIENENNKPTLKVYDNAGGAKQEVIDNIFEANFTTKEIGKGTGIGLYMTKLIIDKIDGKIEAYNYEDGLCFKIMFSN